MTAPHNSNKKPLTEGEWARRQIAARVYESILTPEQMSLYQLIGKSAVADAQESTMTLTIPIGAKAKDLQAVLPIVDLMLDTDTRILLVHEMPRDPDLVTKIDKAALRRFAIENGFQDSRSVKRMLGEATDDGKKRSRMAEADNQALYDKLKTHFQGAAAKHPQYADMFNAELDTYKKVLIDGDPASMVVLAGKLASMVGEPISPPEVDRVLKGALTIFAGTP